MRHRRNRALPVGTCFDMAARLPVIDVIIQAGDWTSQEIATIEVERAIRAAIDTAGLNFSENAELSIVLSDDENVRMLNNKWRKIDRPTNVLSFPTCEFNPQEVAGPLLGDIIIAHETTQREAREQGKPYCQHLTHLLIHGFFHLFGYDHRNDDEAEVMEKLERQSLAVLGIDDPYGEASRHAQC